MNEDDEKRIAAKLARIMAMLCVRNTQLEPAVFTEYV